MVCKFLRRFVVLMILVTMTSAMPVRGDDAEQPIPLTRVVLFSSGVAFFEHEGQVDGTRRVDFHFKSSDIKDVLKSLVVQDLGGGQVATVTYNPPEPTATTLQSFAVDVTRFKSLADVLQQIRGQRVRIEAPTMIEGTIVCVEQLEGQVFDSKTVHDQWLVLKTDNGLRRIPLGSIVVTKLLDENLDREFQKAMDTLASAGSDDKKDVTLEFRGNGVRTVRVSYIQEFPIWKTSYRLVLDNDEKPFLQGWAIFENVSQQDWMNVDLALVSGRPISFTMDLYQSLYVLRPEVAPEHYASVTSRTHDQDLTDRDDELGAIAARSGRRPARQPNAAGLGGMGGGFGMGGGGAGGRGGGWGGGSAGGGVESVPDSAGSVGTLERLNLGKGVAAAATTNDLGELFRYKISAPVNLPRKRSAMLPIVSQAVSGEKEYLFSPEVHARHPLAAFRLNNSTELHLMHGPITVFDGGEYAGDARIEDIPPASSRLISFALDLDTEVAIEQDNQVTDLVSAKILKGLLVTSHKTVRGKRYLVKNAGETAKSVLIEQPVDAAWTLTVPPEATEKTHDRYRFRVGVESGQTVRWLVQEEQTSETSIRIGGMDDQMAEVLLVSKSVSPEIQESLREAAKRRAALADATKARSIVEKMIETLVSEQTRVRSNLLQLDRASDLYQRFYQKIGVLEDQIEEHRKQLREAQDVENRLQTSYNDYLSSLTVP